MLLELTIFLIASRGSVPIFASNDGRGEVRGAHGRKDIDLGCLLGGGRQCGYVIVFLKKVSMNHMFNSNFFYI